MNNWDKIFKAYDIRGIYPEEINREIAYKIGRAVGKFFNAQTEDKTFRLRTKREKTIVLARDNRLSSEELFNAVREGIRDESVNLVDIGLSTTPMFYYAVFKLKLDGGIIITASHNPKEYNGFKIIKKDALFINERESQEIKELLIKDNFAQKSSKGHIAITQEITADYINEILELSHVNEIDPYKIVVDTANSVAILSISELEKYLKNIKIIKLFDKLDGSFPNHDPNPIYPQNTKILQERVLSEKADLGIAFDGDGDRILFIDEKGERIDPDLIAATIIRCYYKRAGKILYTAVTSRIVRDEALDSGNEVICSRIGHTFIKEAMAREKVVFGCEASGHYYFQDMNYVESPLLVFLKIMEAMSRTKMTLSALVGQLQRFYQNRIDFKINNINQANSCIKKVEAHYKKISRFGRLPNIFYIDGTTVEYTDWWFNVRNSNTEPIIRLTIEADTEELLEEKTQEIRQMIELD
jgi:phosphomannomutase